MYFSSITQVERSFKDAMTAYSNLAVSTYRMANKYRSNKKKFRSLMTSAYHSIHHNVEKLDANNRGILNDIDVGILRLFNHVDVAVHQQI